MFARRQGPARQIRWGSAVSRNDFLDSLRLLGARMNVPRPCDVGGVPCELQEIALNCSRDAWERVIGPPRNIVSHYSPARRGIYHTWEHHWVGGSVKCFGCLFGRSSDSRWLVLSRVLFCDRRSDTPSAAPPARLEHVDAARQPA